MAPSSKPSDDCQVGPPLVRPPEAADNAQILGLAADTLGWGPEPRWASLFHWKHDQNPFGGSPRWVAVEDDRVVGFRVYLRWEFIDDTGRIHRAVRAVDTATDPAHQGKGIFKHLTLASLDDLAADGTDFVFNTPNSQSRPGYLKMGWEVVGRPLVMALPTGPRGLARLRGARSAAELWSEPSTAGIRADEVLADAGAMWLVDHLKIPAGLTTNRTMAFLTWRYGLDELHYRALSLSADAAEGLAIFRVRRRGTALEATVTELLVPAGADAGRRKRRLLRLVARRSGADYVLVGHDPALLGAPAVPAPGLGPVLTWRAVNETSAPALDAWPLTMGDLELF